MSGVIRGQPGRVGGALWRCQSFSASIRRAEVGPVEEDSLAGLALPHRDPAVGARRHRAGALRAGHLLHDSHRTPPPDGHLSRNADGPGGDSGAPSQGAGEYCSRDSGGYAAAQPAPVTGLRATSTRSLDQPGAVIAMAHRGGALHPEIPGIENTLHAFEHAVALGYHYLETDVHATRDGVLLAFHDDVLDRVTDPTGELAELDRRRDLARPASAARTPVPTMAELLEEFPDCRFNIDLKSARRRASARRPGRAHRQPRPGLRRRRSPSAGSTPSAAPPPDGWRPRSRRSRWPLFLALPRGRAARTAHPRTRRGPAGAAPPRAAAHRHPRSYDAPTRPARTVHVWTVDEPAEMDAAARPGRRRADHRPDRRAQARC